MSRIAVLASGRGSNLQAILDNVESGFIPHAEVAVVISDKQDAYALTRARNHGIEALFIDPKDHHTHEDFNQRIADELARRRVDYVLLAGYMRIVKPNLIAAYKNRILNVHPALLPSFPGLNGQKQALEYGAKVSGCTVHFVDEEVDHGPIIIQAAVPVLEDDTEDTLSKRILTEEHRIYPQAVRWLVEGRLRIDGRRVRVRGLRQAGSVQQVL